MTRLCGHLSNHLLSFPLLSACNTLSFFLVAFLRAGLSFVLKSDSLWVKWSWRQSCCLFLKFVLCVWDTFVSSDILLAAWFWAELSCLWDCSCKLSNILLNLCWCCYVSEPCGAVGQCFNGEKRSLCRDMDGRDSWGNGQCGASRRNKTPSSSLHISGVFLSTNASGGAEELSFVYLLGCAFWIDLTNLTKGREAGAWLEISSVGLTAGMGLFYPLLFYFTFRTAGWRTRGLVDTMHY